MMDVVVDKQLDDIKVLSVVIINPRLGTAVSDSFVAKRRPLKY